MRKLVVTRSERAFRALLFVYPKQYRKEYGTEMEFVFSKTVREAVGEQSPYSIMRLWLRTVADTIISAIMQHIEHKGEVMKTVQNDILNSNKIFGWILLGIGAILLIPLIAMQFTNDVDWNAFDFIVMGGLMFITATSFVLLARYLSVNRLVLAAALGVVFLLVWAELAVGLFGSPFAGS